jgi:hypothetical protein
MASAQQVFDDILKALELASATLKGVSGPVGEVAAFVEVADHALEQAIAAHKAAGLAVDWSTIQPIDPVV